jgi:hypothetical protein
MVMADVILHKGFFVAVRTLYGEKIFFVAPDAGLMLTPEWLIVGTRLVKAVP